MMIPKDDIVIRKGILHVLDTAHGDCLLSNRLLDPGPDLYEFIRGHIYKIINSDNTRRCTFNPETSPLYALLASWEEEDEASFIETSRILGERLYQEMCQSPSIPAGDLLFVTFQAAGEIYLALLKLDYKDTYTHHVDRVENVAQSGADSADETPLSRENSEPDILTSIVRTHGLFPSAASRIPEAAIIRLSDLEIRLLEKSFDINGEKVFYLSENFLVCNSALPPKKKLDLLTKVIHSISNKYDDADPKAKMDTKSALCREYRDKQAFDIEEIGTALFGSSPEKKAEFDEKMEEYDLQFDRFSITSENTIKKLDRQMIVTDSGIEISVPMDVYNKLANLEVQTDPSGKSTIIIRNIDNLIVK